MLDFNDIIFGNIAKMVLVIALLLTGIQTTHVDDTGAYVFLQKYSKIDFTDYSHHRITVLMIDITYRKIVIIS